MFQTEERVTTSRSPPGCLRPEITITRRDAGLWDLNPVVPYRLSSIASDKGLGTNSSMPGVMSRRRFYQHALVTLRVALTPGDAAILGTARLNLTLTSQHCFGIRVRNWRLPEQRECALPRPSQY